MAAATFTTEPRDVWDLEAGDAYIWGTERETREVLGVIQRGPSHSALLEVRKPSGDVVRSTISGTVRIVVGVAVETDRDDYRERLGAGADYARGSEIIGARVFAALARI